MKIEVLASVMNQDNINNLVKKMNLQGDALIINQCDKNSYEEIKRKSNTIRFMSLAEIGIGLSRNNALMRATGDIVVFADEDMIYKDGYEKIILENFQKHPDADMIVFNVPSLNPNRSTVKIMKNSRVHKYNCLRYGAVNIAIKLKKQKEINIWFSLLFGGGAKYSAGEDSLFVYNWIKSGGRVYASTDIIGNVEQKSSSWFEGYTDKYFRDKGVFYYYLSNKFYKSLSLQFLLRHRKKFKGLSFFDCYKKMKCGWKSVKNGEKNE